MYKLNLWRVAVEFLINVVLFFVNKKRGQIVRVFLLALEVISRIKKRKYAGKSPAY
jgi:hypothetical protein